MIDFCSSKDNVVDTPDNPIDDFKVKEEFLNENPEEMVCWKDGDLDMNETNSYLVTSKCPLQIFRRNITKKSVTSSITNVVPSMSKMKRAANYFNLEFIHEAGDL